MGILGILRGVHVPFRDINIPPRFIEAVAVGFALVVIIVGICVFHWMPAQEVNREEIIKLIGAVVGALGVASLLLLWAQLRHTATLNQLLSYHEYFHELPNKHTHVLIDFARLGSKIATTSSQETHMFMEKTGL
jgi:hypothetical protein